MIYDIKAIPTDYNGVTFRSRLEARWAAFFDEFKIAWDYEPFDLEGWSPDFSIRGPGGKQMLVEVKPFSFVDWPNRPDGQHGEMAKTFRKVIPHARKNPVLLLGTTPFERSFKDADGKIKSDPNTTYVGMVAYDKLDWDDDKFVSFYSSMLVMDNDAGAHDFAEHPILTANRMKRFRSESDFTFIGRKDVLVKVRQDNGKFRIKNNNLPFIRSDRVMDAWMSAGNACRWYPERRS